MDNSLFNRGDNISFVGQIFWLDTLSFFKLQVEVTS